MINLDVKDYCHHGCMDFAPVVSKRESYMNLGGDTYIRCENAKRCEYMMRYLNNHKEGSDEQMV